MSDIFTVTPLKTDGIGYYYTLTNFYLIEQHARVKFLTNSEYMERTVAARRYKLHKTEELNVVNVTHRLNILFVCFYGFFQQINLLRVLCKTER